VISNNKTQILVGAEECALLTTGAQTLENESRMEAQQKVNPELGYQNFEGLLYSILSILNFA